MDTIISIIVTFILSLALARWQMKRNKIVHYLINSYDIGKGLSNDFSEFELHYSGQKMADKVSVIKGGFVSLGRNDMVNPKFDLALPKGCVIKAIKITRLKEDLIAYSEIDKSDSNIIHFTFENLFSSKEFFEYTAIVEVPDELDKVEEKITFHHRIKNTDKIQSTNIGPYERKVRSRKRMNVFLLFYAIPIMTLMFSFCFLKPVHFNISNKETNERVSVYINKSSDLIVSNPNKLLYWRGDKISKKEFSDNYVITTNLDYDDGFNREALALMVILGLLLIMFCMLNINKQNRIIRIINNKDTQKKWFRLHVSRQEKSI